MAQRLTQFTRICNYFRSADIIEAKAALNAAGEIVTSREVADVKPLRRKRTRKEKAAPLADAATSNG